MLSLLPPTEITRACVSVKVIETLFNELFHEPERTVLCSGAEEPLYLPADQSRVCAEIHSRADYVSSALHEISHWCIAGKARRQQEDYGYWYEPDGRDVLTQQRFERVEVKPQALEWVFSVACGVDFRLSVDNVAQPELGPSEAFAVAVTGQANRYLESGLSGRAKLFFDRLCEHYGCFDRIEDLQPFRLSKVFRN
ncbi:MAG: transporting ATPase [Oleiphilus sp.]|nr:MAG: transporting ATPase [Oleiphilus sp.]